MRLVTAGVAALAVLCLAGYATADAFDVAPGVLTLSAPPPAPAVRASPPPAPPRTPAAQVLAGLSAQAPEPAPSAMSHVLAPLLAGRALGSGVSAYVVDAASGDVLLDLAGEVPRTPASTTKLLTAAAVLSTVGAAARLPTRAVQGASPDEVVLVGGGDMLLGTGASDPAHVVGRAGLGTLAAQTAKRLATAGIARVAVRFDDSAFSGPTASPRWAPTDLSSGFTGRVAALGLARDRAHPGHPGPASPALSAARAFAAALSAQGVTVVGGPARTTAPDRPTVLGEVESAPVGDVLGVALRESDNALAGVMARLTARSLGRPPTFEDAALAVVDQVQRLGVDIGPTRIVDGSGLGRGSRVPARVLADVLALAASPDHPELRPILQGLPVAGFTGTLGHRFDAKEARAAAGTVRAKTGTLTGVSSLAGLTVDADGRLLVFALMADHVPAGGTGAARTAADRVGAALTACGCR